MNMISVFALFVKFSNRECSVEFHWLFACYDLNLVTVFFENLATILSVRVSIWLREHLLVIGSMVTLVLNLSFFDYADINVGT